MSMKGCGRMAKYSEAQNKAVQKYTKKAYDTFVVRVKKGQKDNIAQAAAKRGLSLNAYIVSLIKKDNPEFDNKE